MKTHTLTTESVKMHVPKGIRGNYKLGVEASNKFHILYVGRSDTSLRRRLLEHAKAGIYTHFSFRSCSGNKTTFLRECSDYHSDDNLDNEIHPSQTEDDMSCPICDAPKNFEGCFPRKKVLGEVN